MSGVDTDVTTTQMTIMGVVMVVCALVIAGTILLFKFRNHKTPERETHLTESKFHGEAH